LFHWRHHEEPNGLFEEDPSLFEEKRDVTKWDTFVADSAITLAA
jgi:hypothetical protein